MSHLVFKLRRTLCSVLQCYMLAELTLDIILEMRKPLELKHSKAPAP